MCERFARWGAVSKDDGSWQYIGPSKMDWGYHIQPMPDFANEDDVNKWHNKVIAEELDMDKPLWRFYYGTTPEQKGYYFCRYHHALGDGLAIDSFLRYICKNEDGGSLPQENVALRKFLEAQKKSFWKRIGAAIVYAFMFVFSVFRVLFKASPFYPFETDCSWTNPRRKQDWQGEGEINLVKFPEIELRVLKEVKDHMNQTRTGVTYTVNDVLYAIVSGMIRRYCQHEQNMCPRMFNSHSCAQDYDIEDINIRSIVAVAFPRSFEGLDYRDVFVNNFALGPIKMPVNAPDPISRCRIYNNLSFNFCFGFKTEIKSIENIHH